MQASRTGSVHHAQSPESYVRLQGRRRWRRGARGFRLCPRNRLSVRRLRAGLRTLLGLVGRYVRLLVRKLATSRGGCARRSGSRRRVLVVVAGRDSKVPAPIVRSNSSYAQAVADCLEFIKRNSVPVEDSTAAPAPAPAPGGSLRLEQGQDGRRNGTRKTM